MASLVERLERELDAAAGAGDSARYAAVLERVAQACCADPDLEDEFDMAQVYGELAMEYASLGRCDDALEAVDAALDAGLQPASDPRCLRAQVLMQGGRVDEAETLWAAVRAETPEDVWLYFYAGLEYGDVGAHATALEWLTEGLTRALRGDDPDDLVEPLTEMREYCLTSLGQSPDTLQELAATFLDDREELEEEPADDGSEFDDHHLAGPIAVAWFPAGDYEAAVAAWPALADSELIAGPGGPVPHAQYCRAMQDRLIAHAEAGVPALAVAPVRVEEFGAWCTEQGYPPDASESRADYATHLAAQAGVIAWPPGRNEACWCGSGRKYKKCCAAR